MFLRLEAVSLTTLNAWTSGLEETQKSRLSVLPFVVADCLRYRIDTAEWVAGVWRSDRTAISSRNPYRIV